jgi:hypothetical protein
VSLSKADIVKEYLRKHPDMASRTVAKHIYKRHPTLWGSEDTCVKMVLYYRKAVGVKQRAQREGKEEFPRIPKADKQRKSRMSLTDAGRWLVIGDLHCPFHDENALEAVLKYAKDEKCEHLLVNGDALDAYQNSHWMRDPSRRSVDSEISILKEIFGIFDKQLPGRKVYKIGNHEERIENYLFTHAPGMIGMSEWNLCNELQERLEIPKWAMIESKQLYGLGKLNGYHGHELPKGLTNPVSVGRGLWNRTRQTGFTNHWHTTSTHIETSGNKDKTWVCFSVGCLCDLQPSYAPVNGWNHGFCIVDIAKNGDFREQNRRIVSGEIW